MKELQIIQSKLKVPKNQYNSFGDFRYRSLEDICEAIKPLLSELECTLTFSDGLISLNGEIYVQASARLKNKDNEVECATAYAREEKARPKMSPSQLTGGASSYARKYAVAGLFLLDDTKDADTYNTTEIKENKQTPQKTYKQKLGEFVANKMKLEVKKINREIIIGFLGTEGIEYTGDFNEKDCADLIKLLTK